MCLFAYMLFFSSADVFLVLFIVFPMPLVSVFSRLLCSCPLVRFPCFFCLLAPCARLLGVPVSPCLSCHPVPLCPLSLWGVPVSPCCSLCSLCPLCPWVLALIVLSLSLSVSFPMALSPCPGPSMCLALSLSLPYLMPCPCPWPP